MSRLTDNAESAAVTKAGQIMSTPVVSVAPRAPIREVADALTQHQISAVPVVDDGGNVLGMVSEYDLLANAGTVAAEVMTTAVISVSADTAIADVRHLLVERRIRRVPVLAAGRLVGIVSRGDVVALLTTEWVCEVCGEPVHAEQPPQMCPKCQAGPERFVLQEQPPGA